MAALPTTGITTSMVAKAIGEGSNDVGTLCKSTKINKWSKWKPIRSNKITGITEQVLQSVNFGFPLQGLTDDPQDVISYDFLYNKPRGGAYNEFFRLGDFRGYNHNALAPLIAQENIKFYPKFQNYVDVDIKNSMSDLNVTMLDDYSDMYYAVLFFKTGTFIGYMTSVNKISANNTYIRFGSEFPVNATKYYVCAATEDSVGYSTSIYGDLKALPYNAPTDSGGTVTSSNDFPGTISIIGINKSISASYTQVANISSSNPFQLDDSGNANIIITVSPTVTVNLVPTFFTVSARPTFGTGAAAPYKTGVIEAEVYEISDGNISTFKGGYIQGKTTKTLLISAPNLMRYYNGVDMEEMTPGTKNVSFIIDYDSKTLATKFIYLKYL
jgi:hypothetical protein